MALLVIPILLLNFFAGLTGGGWLLLDGHWLLVLIGIVAIFFSKFWIMVALLPGMAFAAPAVALSNRGAYRTAWLLGSLALLWTHVVMVLWALACFHIVGLHYGSGPTWPYVLLAYATATAPWNSMAMFEARSDPTSHAPTAAMLLCVGCLFILTDALVQSNGSDIRNLICLVPPMLFSYISQIIAARGTMLAVS